MATTRLWRLNATTAMTQSSRRVSYATAASSIAASSSSIRRPSASLFLQPTQLHSNSSNRSGALGSSLGTDSSMIAANNRCNTMATTRTMKNSNMCVSRSNSSRNLRFFSTTTTTTTTTPNATTDDNNNTNDSDTTATTTMEDEYGVMTSDGRTYTHPEPFVLENGQVLPTAQLRYQTYGTLNDETRDNVLVVCHALTGNASLDAWWGGLLGPGKAFDTDRYLVVCCNILGSCYGSTGPTSIDPETDKPYGKDFPDVSVRDTVRIQLEMLVHELKVKSIKSVVGGSFGGMQALEFAVQAGSGIRSPYADDCYFTNIDLEIPGNNPTVPLVRTVIPIACGAAHTAWQIAISETQRQAIYADPDWETGGDGEDGAGWNATRGLAVARQIGMISYRTAAGYCQKFGRDIQSPDWKNSPSAAPVRYGKDAHWKVRSYLEYQGEKFLSRFDPITYVKMTEQMDSHDLARGRYAIGTNRHQQQQSASSSASPFEEVLSYVEIPARVLGIDSDVLYPLSEQEELAKYLPNGELHVIHSDDGHDGFLLEQEQVAHLISEFLEQHD